jgi:hypothetical protein
MKSTLRRKIWIEQTGMRDEQLAGEILRRIRVATHEKIDDRRSGSAS